MSRAGFRAVEGDDKENETEPNGLPTTETSLSADGRTYSAAIEPSWSDTSLKREP